MHVIGAKRMMFSPSAGQTFGAKPYYQTTAKINDLHLDNTRFQIRWEGHIPGWNASAWRCRHHQ